MFSPPSWNTRKPRFFEWFLKDLKDWRGTVSYPGLLHILFDILYTYSVYIYIYTYCIYIYVHIYVICIDILYTHDHIISKPPTSSALSRLWSPLLGMWKLRYRACWDDQKKTTHGAVEGRTCWFPVTGTGKLLFIGSLHKFGDIHLRQLLWFPNLILWSRSVGDLAPQNAGVEANRWNHLGMFEFFWWHPKVHSGNRWFWIQNFLLSQVTNV